MWDAIVNSAGVLTGEFQRGSLAAYLIIAAIGLCAGSFLSVAVNRLPRMEGLDDSETPNAASPDGRYNLATPASHCVRCGHSIRWYENIPVVSYIALRARCSACGARISMLYPTTEILACAVAVIALWRFEQPGPAFGAMALGWALIAISAIDLRERYIPDLIVLPMIWIGLACNAFSLFANPAHAIFGAIAGYAFLWSLCFIYRVATGKTGIGRGDFKLLAMLGAWLGVEALPVVLFISFTSGAVFGLAAIVFARARLDSAIPFGPFIAAAGWLTLHWSAHITAAYGNFLRTLGIAW